jgi:mono/diheme cytochrome c family protein
MRKFPVLLSAVSLLAADLSPTNIWSQTLASNGATRAPVTYARDVLPIVLGRCYSCHNDQTKFLPSWTDYQTAFAHRREIKRRVWDSWQGRYYKEAMPAGNSPQGLAMTEAERETIKDWVEDGAVYGVPPAWDNAPTRLERLALGRQLFGVACIPCHQANGGGLPGRFPPLAASDFLNADKGRAIRILLNGRQGEIVVNGRTFNSSMPRFPLTDEQIAGVLTYVYGSFGNSGKDVSPEEVKDLRRQKDMSPIQSNSSPTAKPSQFE